MFTVPTAWQAGSDPTGYDEPGARIALKDRYSSDIISQAPDICILTMSFNDFTAYASKPGSVTTTATTIWDAITSALTACELIIIGPWPNGGARSSIAALYVTMDAALRALAVARGLRYISPLAEG